MRKSLSLKREALAELSPADLVAVAAGQQELTHATCTTCTSIINLPTDNCFSLEQCRTLPVRDCISIVTPGSLPC